MQKTEAYGADLAYIHDTGYGDFARNAGPALLRVIGTCEDTSKLVVDLGCGSGIWAKLLVDAGYDVAGVDISAAMIEIARQRVPAATFEISSFVDFPIPACRAVTALGEVFSYLFDESNSQATLRRMFQNAFDALASGGVLIFDIAEPERSRGIQQLFREGDGWACLVEFRHDDSRQQLIRRIVTFRRFGEVYRRHEELHQQQLYKRGDIAELLRGIGFQVEIIGGYGEAAFPVGLAGFVARKP